jgi:hypothetical protein
MLFAKIQGSEPVLFDNTQLTEESILNNYRICNWIFAFFLILFIVIAFTDDNNISYIEEIKKRKYTKEFHSFIKSTVSTRLESRYKKEVLL